MKYIKSIILSFSLFALNCKNINTDKRIENQNNEKPKKSNEYDKNSNDTIISDSLKSVNYLKKDFNQLNRNVSFVDSLNMFVVNNEK
jgi:hypothetical protein